MTADAYGIPAAWTTLEPPLGGGAFKFHDYESVITPGATRFVRYRPGMSLSDSPSRAPAPRRARRSRQPATTLEASAALLPEALRAPGRFPRDLPRMLVDPADTGGQASDAQMRACSRALRSHVNSRGASAAARRGARCFAAGRQEQATRDPGAGGVHEDAGVADHLGQASSCRGDHRDVRGHRLERGQAEPLVGDGTTTRRRGGDEPGHDLVGQPAPPAVARQPSNSSVRRGWGDRQHELTGALASTSGHASASASRFLRCAAPPACRTYRSGSPSAREAVGRGSRRRRSAVDAVVHDVRLRMPRRSIASRALNSETQITAAARRASSGRAHGRRLVGNRQRRRRAA